MDGELMPIHNSFSALPCPLHFLSRPSAKIHHSPRPKARRVTPCAPPGWTYQAAGKGLPALLLVLPNRRANLAHGCRIHRIPKGGGHS